MGDLGPPFFPSNLLIFISIDSSSKSTIHFVKPLFYVLIRQIFKLINSFFHSLKHCHICFNAENQKLLAQKTNQGKKKSFAQLGFRTHRNFGFRNFGVAYAFATSSNAEKGYVELTPEQNTRRKYRHALVRSIRRLIRSGSSTMERRFCS